jgi:hypothetical protein
MRQIYSSPRQSHIDAVVALMAEHGIETIVTNRSNYNRQTWQRFSYAQQQDNSDNWPQVWINKADDYARARTLLRGIGIEPAVRFGAELAAARKPTPDAQRRHAVARARRLAMLAVLVACTMVVLRYLHVV